MPALRIKVGLVVKPAIFGFFAISSSDARSAPSENSLMGVGTDNGPSSRLSTKAGRSLPRKAGRACRQRSGEEPQRFRSSGRSQADELHPLLVVVLLVAAFPEGKAAA